MRERREEREERREERGEERGSQRVSVATAKSPRTTLARDRASKTKQQGSGKAAAGSEREALALLLCLPPLAAFLTVLAADVGEVAARRERVGGVKTNGVVACCVG